MVEIHCVPGSKNEDVIHDCKGGTKRFMKGMKLTECMI